MKAIYGAVILMAATSVVSAQKVENDDMYFTSKDRAKSQANVVSVSRNPVQTEKKDAPAPTSENDVALNPTDSYSARNINPEYSGNQGAKGTTSKGDYFVEDYRPTGVNGNLNGNYAATSGNPYSTYNNNPYAYSPYSSFGSMGYGYPMSSMSSFGMGMYGMGMYPYGMGGFGYSPYGYGPSMSMSMAMRYGYDPWMYNSMMYGGFYSPYSAMYDPFMMSGMGMYNPYSFYGYNTLYSGYSYPGTVMVDKNQVNGRTVTYGRRSERSTSEQYEPDDTRSAVTQSRTGRTLSGGRTRSTDGTQTYYERGWRNNTNDGSSRGTATTRSFWSGQSQSSDTEPGSWGNSGRSDGSSWNSWDNNSNTGSSWSSGGNRSSFSGGSSSFGGGGGGRSSMGGSGGGGGHTRGRD